MHSGTPPPSIPPVGLASPGNFILFRSRGKPGGHVTATVPRRGPFVFLSPIRRQCIAHSKILVGEYTVGHGPAFRQRSDRVTRARPCALYQDDSCRHLVFWLHVVRKVAAILG